MREVSARSTVHRSSSGTVPASLQREGPFGTGTGTSTGTGTAPSRGPYQPPPGGSVQPADRAQASGSSSESSRRAAMEERDRRRYRGCQGTTLPGSHRGTR